NSLNHGPAAKSRNLLHAYILAQVSRNPPKTLTVPPYSSRKFGLSEPPTVTAALPVVERLIRTVAAETEDIAAGRPAPYELYGQRKSQSLLELNRLLPPLTGAR